MDGQSGGELIKFKVKAVKADRDRSAATLGVVSCRAWTPSVVRVLLAQAGTCLRSARARNLRAFTEYERAGRYWKDALPGRTLAHIVPGDIARYMAQRSQEVAPATINRALSFLRRVFNVAIADGKADRNPVRAVKFFKRTTSASASSRRTRSDSWQPKRSRNVAWRVTGRSE